jgi:hypothetical protein
MRMITVFLIVPFCAFLASCEIVSEPRFVEIISDSGGTVETGYSTFPLSVSAFGKVVSVEKVTLDDLYYETASDLTISLQKSGGPSVILVNMRGGTNDYVGDYEFVSDDEERGLSHIVTWSGDVVPETYQAEGEFDDFEGYGVGGTWIIEVYNSSLTTTGTLSSWSLCLRYD